MMKKLVSMAVLAAAISAGGAARAQSADNVNRVLIIPFTTLNVPDSQQWMAKGVQENLVADFGRNGGFVPVAFQGQVVVEDNATAARLARQASAPYAIRGAAQVVGGTVRLTAQLIDARTGDTVSTGVVTGSTNDLLKLEDELSAQLRGGPAVAGGAPPPTAPAPIEPAAAESTPTIVYVTQPTSPALGYDPGYGYSYWNNGLYGYPGIYWPIAVPLDPDGHHHHHHPRPGDDCDPPRPPIEHPRPQPTSPPVHAFQPGVPQPGGFTLPIPQNGGFSSPVPTGGFGLPIPRSGSSPLVQTGVQSNVQWSSPAAAQWHGSSPVVPAVRTVAPRATVPVSTPRVTPAVTKLAPAPRVTAPVAVPRVAPPAPAPRTLMTTPTGNTSTMRPGMIEFYGNR